MGISEMKELAIMKIMQASNLQEKEIIYAFFKEILADCRIFLFDQKCSNFGESCKNKKIGPCWILGIGDYTQTWILGLNDDLNDKFIKVGKTIDFDLNILTYINKLMIGRKINIDINDFIEYLNYLKREDFQIGITTATMERVKTNIDLNIYAEMIQSYVKLDNIKYVNRYIEDINLSECDYKRVKQIYDKSLKQIDDSIRQYDIICCCVMNLVKRIGATQIDEELKDKINLSFELKSEKEIRAGIENTLTELLDGSDNKTKKIELLQRNVLTDQKVRALKKADWIEIIDSILLDIYKYIDTDSSEGQDILNLFFIAFNKYTGKADKNQAFTPDHITEFMCRLTEVDHTKRVLDGTCGSASFLVQAMVKELADCRIGHTEAETKALQTRVKKENIYGIEVEEKAFGLSVTNMLIHGDGNSNIKLGSCFEQKTFIKDADPNIILMNPPYNAKPIGIPASYKTSWTSKQKKGTADPTKGLVFVRYFSDVVKELNKKRKQNLFTQGKT